MKKLLACCVVIVFMVGCASVPLELKNVDNQNYKVLGEGTGTATGIMLFGVIPIGQNQRFERAYNAAVASNLISRRNYNDALPGSWMSKALRISRCALVTSVRI